MQVVIVFGAMFSILIPIGVGLWRYSNLSKDARWLLYMLFPIAVNQFLSEWWIQYVNQNNIVFGHIYLVIELFFLSKIYFDYHRRSRFAFLIPVFTGLFYLFYIVRLLYDPMSFLVYSTYERALTGLIIVGYSISYFISVYQKQEVLELHRTSGFWMAGGLILYLLSNTILYVFGELIFVQEYDVYLWVWSVHAVLTFLLYISYTMAFLCNRTEIKS